jgi:hypothetical protein
MPGVLLLKDSEQREASCDGRLILLASSKLLTMDEDATEHTMRIRGKRAEPLAKYMPVCLLRNFRPDID